MVSAADPSYPLYPIGCILSAGILLPVLLTSFVRQRWNVGVGFLCFWLFFENLTNGINAIIWADNADIKLYVYCDICEYNLSLARVLKQTYTELFTKDSHLQLITDVVKPMATLIITRRLYLITSLQPVTFLDRAAVCRIKTTCTSVTNDAVETPGSCHRLGARLGDPRDSCRTSV